MATVGNYPKSLQYAVNKIAGFSKNTVKVLSSTMQTANPGDLSIFQFPANQLCDLSSVVIKGDLAVARGGTANDYVVVPRFAGSFVDLVDVSIAGQSIDGSAPWYGHLYRIMNDYLYGDKFGQRSAIELGQVTSTNANLNLPIVESSASVAQFQGNASMPTAIVTDPNGTVTGLPLYLTGHALGGFLSCGKCIDTSLVSDMRVSVRWAPNTILAANADVSSATYQLQNLCMIVDVWSLDDGIFYALLQSRLATAPIEIPYVRWVSYTGPSFTSSTSIRWATSTQSLESVYATFVPTAGATTKSVTSASGSLALNTSGTVPVPYYQHVATGVGTVAWSVNGIYYPAYPQSVTECYHQLINTLATGDDSLGSINSNINLASYYQGYFATGFRFGVPQDQVSGPLTAQWTSGLNSLGTQMNGTLEVVASSLGTSIPGTGLSPYLYARTHATLAIGAWRAVQIVQ